MKTTFESLLEEIIPEINFLTASGAGIKPGHMLESLEKDIVVGYLPDFIKDLPSMKNKSFELIEEAYDIKLEEVEGTVSHDAAIKVMDLLGLKANHNLTYRLGFELSEITSVKFAYNLDKINFEIALSELKKLNKDSRKIFKRLKGHILVLRVIYANKYEISVEVEKDGNYEADVNVKEVDVSANMNYEKIENTIIVSNNKDVPFGVVGYKIKGNRLKEID